MPRKTTITGEDNTADEIETTVDPQPIEQIITLKLKQRAYWRGELCEAGTPFDYPKAQANEILTNTELFTAA